MCKSSLIKVVADNFATVTQGENTHNWLGPSTQLLPHYLSHFSQLQRILPPGAHFFSSLKCGEKVSSCQSFIEMRLAFGRSSILSGEVGLTQCQSEQVFVAWDCDPSADTGKKRGVRKCGFLRAQCGHQSRPRREDLGSRVLSLKVLPTGHPHPVLRGVAYKCVPGGLNQNIED